MRGAKSPLERLKGLRSHPGEQAAPRKTLQRGPGAGVQVLEFPSIEGSKGAEVSAEDKVESDVTGRRLQEAGWLPTESLGKTIWRDPQDGFWLSQEMALVTLERRK